MNDLVQNLKDQKDKVLRRRGIIDSDLNPPWPIQEKFHRSNHRIRVYSGSNFSGKTHTGGREVYWWCSRTHPYKPWVNEKSIPIAALMICVDQKQQKAPGGPQQKLLSLIPKDMIADIDYEKKNVINQIIFKNGSTINFRTKKMGREGLQGARYSIIWVDEDCVPDGEYFDELSTRFPDDGDRVYQIYTFTPNLNQYEDSWLVENILEKANTPEEPDYRMWNATIHDNPKMGKQALQDALTGLKGSEASKAARLYGDFRGKEGLVYPLFDKNVHIIPEMGYSQLKQMKAIFRIIDPHPSKPIRVIFCGVTPSNNFIIFDEMDHSGLIEQVAEAMRQRCSNLGHLIERTIIDYSANAKDKISGRSATDEFKRFGISCVNSKKDKVSGIQEVRKVLYFNVDQNTVPRLYITANCVFTIREFCSYRFDPKTGLPIKKRDESMDCVRYWVMDPSMRQYIGYQNSKENFQIVDIDEQANRILLKNARARRRAEQIGGGIGRATA